MSGVTVVKLLKNRSGGGRAGRNWTGGWSIDETAASRAQSNRVEAVMPATLNKTYTTYGLSLWRWVSASLEERDSLVRERIDAELEMVLEDAGLYRAPDGVDPDLLLRYEAAPGVLVAELVDARTNEGVWKTDLRGDARGRAEEPLRNAWRV